MTRSACAGGANEHRGDSAAVSAVPRHERRPARRRAACAVLRRHAERSIPGANRRARATRRTEARSDEGHERAAAFPGRVRESGCGSWSRRRPDGRARRSEDNRRSARAGRAIDEHDCRQDWQHRRQHRCDAAHDGDPWGKHACRVGCDRRRSWRNAADGGRREPRRQRADGWCWWSGWAGHRECRRPAGAACAGPAAERRDAKARGSCKAEGHPTSARATHAVEAVACD